MVDNKLLPTVPENDTGIFTGKLVVDVTVTVFDTAVTL